MIDPSLIPEEPEEVKVVVSAESFPQTQEIGAVTTTASGRRKSASSSSSAERKNFYAGPTGYITPGSKQLKWDWKPKYSPWMGREIEPDDKPGGLDDYLNFLAMYHNTMKFLDKNGFACAPDFTSDQLIKNNPILFKEPYDRQNQTTHYMSNLNMQPKLWKKTPPEDRVCCFVSHAGIIRKQTPTKGCGYFATRPLPEGTLLLLEKPLAALMDTELAKQEWYGEDSGDTLGLACALGQIDRAKLSNLNKLHPPLNLPKEAYKKTGEPDLPPEFDAAVDEAWKDHGLTDMERDRYIAVCRYNSLGFYTNSEQSSFHYNYRPLTGTGLYPLSSGFNHSCAPNVTRYNIGDIIFFRTTSKVNEGDELCISYCEMETLAEPMGYRHEALDRDFVCNCERCEEEKRLPRRQKVYFDIDAEFKATIHQMDIEERITTLRVFISGEAFEEQAKEEGLAKPQCLTIKDIQDLRAILASSYMKIQDYQNSYLTWKEAAFVHKKMRNAGPDESIVGFLTCAWLCKLEIDPRDCSLMNTILTMHKLFFGAGAAWYRVRYEHDASQVLVSDRAKMAWKEHIDRTIQNEFEEVMESDMQKKRTNMRPKEFGPLKKRGRKPHKKRELTPSPSPLPTPMDSSVCSTPAYTPYTTGTLSPMDTPSVSSIYSPEMTPSVSEFSPNSCLSPTQSITMSPSQSSTYH